MAVAVLVILLAYGCAEEQPTAPTDKPQTPREPSLVIRGYPDGPGCVPEVITESTDSTETILTTLNAPGRISCMPNLVQWGIDMADPVGVDTPQGNGFFRIESESRIAVNMPSPPYAAHGANYTPPQVMIEFDPPVRSVEFYYSRLSRARAYWGGQIVDADSMPVYAMSRTPGTLSYQFWDRKTLYSNVAHTIIPYDTWTYAKLATTSGDKIQWLWFDGTLMIDDLKITRMPLTCTPATVQRGQQVRCVFSSSPSWNVTGWEFIPDATTLPSVQEASSSKEWTGTAAASGLVKVYVTDGTTPRSWQTRLPVLSRPSQWRANLNYRQGPEQLLPDEEVTSSSLAFGINCPQEFASFDLCWTNWEILQPDPTKVGPGYASNEIPSGPNKGYWIPTNIHYHMKRVGNVHPGILLSSSRKHPVPPDMLTKACKQGLGLKPTATSASANMNQINTYCALSGYPGVDMRVFVPGIFGHEGQGYEVGVGHYDLQESAALEPWNDPYLAIEDRIFASATEMDATLRAAIIQIAGDLIQKQSHDNPINGGPKNNYSPPPGTHRYYWEPDSAGVYGWQHKPFPNKY